MSGPSRPGGQPTGDTDVDHAMRAAGWVEHLRGGGTTPWPRWTGPVDGGGAGAEPAGDAAATPGAAQLELLRRLNKLGPLPHRVDHVLTRPGPGRGPVHLPLPKAGRPAPRPEVLRVAAGVLADLTAELPPRKERRRRRRSRPEPVEGLPRFVLEGPPITVAEVGARLAAVGMAPHQPRFSWLGARPDPGPELVVVLAGPLDDALREVWSSRVQRGAARPWPRFVTQWAGRRALPPAPALDRTVDHWAERLGVGNVHVVVATGGEDTAGDDALGGVAEVLGRPGPLEAAEASQLPWRPDPVRLAAPVVDALRRVNAVLPFVCSTTDREPRLAALVQLARSDGGRWVPPDLPKRHRGWVRSNANRIADALRDSGAVVHGDLDSLREIGPRTGHHVRGGEVLDVMIRMIHRVDAEIMAGPRGGRGGR